MVRKWWNIPNKALEAQDIHNERLVTHSTTFALFADITKKKKD